MKINNKITSFVALFITIIMIGSLFYGIVGGVKPEKVTTTNEPQKLMVFNIFFSNSKKSDGVDCSLVYPVQRVLQVPENFISQEELSLWALLAGPSEEELKDGYYTNINQGVKINNFKIDKGVAYVDFDKTLEEGLAGSCLVTAVRSQIEQTLKQFPEIKEVHISIEQRSEDILQP